MPEFGKTGPILHSFQEDSKAMAAIPPPDIKPMTAQEAEKYLTGPGGRFELVHRPVFGEQIRCWKDAPGSAREVFLNAVKVCTT